MITHDTSAILSQILKEITSLKENNRQEPLLSEEMPLRSTEQNELFAAMAKAQADMPIATRGSINPFFKSNYASFSDIIKASRPVLSKNNLAVAQNIMERENGQKYLYTILMHASGQFVASRLKIMPPKPDIQEFGKYVSYLKRYSYAALVGVADELEDDDGETVMAEVRKDIYPYKKEENKKDPVVINPHQNITISRDQYQILNDALENHPDDELAANLLTTFKIQTLADLPRDQFSTVHKHINKIRAALENK